jgi:hypothetical protein
VREIRRADEVEFSGEGNEITRPVQIETRYSHDGNGLMPFRHRAIRIRHSRRIRGPATMETSEAVDRGLPGSSKGATTNA